ncbi:chymotrypsin-like protein [Daphnia sinensis]|uniref:Chymotrypsin-like protein n=1 Tax=Daphnia sinensis TaxID=1820382 RepID=A0AAD5LBP8_9CRUS|nr:chymotrypsin-like protein [Daphnia sinensis]
MRFLAALLFAVVVAQVAARDLSKYQDRSVLFPRPPVAQKNQYVPVKRAATVDTRGFCGTVKTTNQDRIVGGTEAVPNSLPWQVALFIDDQYFCGGSLISPDWVLTAAHCADNATFFNIMLGAHNVRLTAAEEPNRVEYRSEVYTIHPNWGPNLLRNDMALIKLPEPVTFTDAISPICLAPATEPSHAGDPLHVSGWGKPSDAATGISPVLREVDVVGITNQECVAAYSILTIRDSNICVSTLGGKSSCNGDSGGPLSYINNGVFNQVGVVSFGSNQGCELEIPAGFARVSSFADWISSVTGLVI